MSLHVGASRFFCEPLGLALSIIHIMIIIIKNEDVWTARHTVVCDAGAVCCGVHSSAHFVTHSHTAIFDSNFH
jgi:hypothetical protein